MISRYTDIMSFNDVLGFVCHVKLLKTSRKIACLTSYEDLTKQERTGAVAKSECMGTVNEPYILC